MNDATLWIVIVSLGVGSFLLRFSFLGLIGDRPLPAWLLRYLRYTAVAILPALVAPLVVWSDGTGTEPEPGQIAAAVAALAAGALTRNSLWAILAGAGTLGTFMFLGNGLG